MMEIIIPITREKGLRTGMLVQSGLHRTERTSLSLYVFRNMETLGIDDVRKVLKVGDTASDIKEGKHAGVWSAGVIRGKL